MLKTRKKTYTTHPSVTPEKKHMFERVICVSIETLHLILPKNDPELVELSNLLPGNWYTIRKYLPFPNSITQCPQKLLHVYGQKMKSKEIIHTKVTHKKRFTLPWKNFQRKLQCLCITISFLYRWANSTCWSFVEYYKKLIFKISNASKLRCWSEWEIMLMNPIYIERKRYI